MRGISLLVFAMALTGAHAAELKELGCGRTLEKDGVPHMIMDDHLHVLEAGGRFDAGTAPAGYQLKSIFCARTDIVPAASDYRVVEAGYPLMLFSRDTETKRTRIAVLEMSDGRLRLRSVGEMAFTHDMAMRIQAVLDTSIPQMGKTAR